MQQVETSHCETVFVFNSPFKDMPNSERERFDRLMHGYEKAIGEYKIVYASACHGTNDKAWRHCQPLMAKQIMAINPVKIIPFGKFAVRSVIQWLWNHNPSMLDVWFGARIPSRKLNAWVFPLGMIGRKLNKDISKIWFHRHRAGALAVHGRPYDNVVDYNARVDRVWDAESVWKACRAASQSPVSAFDYETTGLKPENPKQELISASVAWMEGTTTKCAAWMMDDADKLDAMRFYLQSDSRKIAANAKFENRWSKVKLGTKVNRWCLDTVLAAHMLDPAQGVVGLKHQAFARLGQGFYAQDVDKVFESQDEHGLNGIRSVNKHVLLQYNGMDSILELDLGLMQMYEAGISKLWTDSMPKQEFYNYGEYYGR